MGVMGMMGVMGVMGVMGSYTCAVALLRAEIEVLQF